ncbi:hypothetical protein Tco_0389449 [Tanacetum coccineum]
MEKAQTGSSLAKPNPNDEISIELIEEFLMKLRSNAYYGTFDEDVVDHIDKVFPLSLADDARQWWIDEGDGKITTWKELVEKIFCKFYPLSCDGDDEILEEGDNWGLDPLEFISRVNSIFKNHRKVDGKTQKTLLHSWINENLNKEPMNDIVSSDEE